jgi:choice-of-anchor C domain-containing protein
MRVRVALGTALALLMRTALGLLALGTGLAWLALGPELAHAQILVNGNFEAGPAIPLQNPIFAVTPGNPALTGWTVTGGAVSIITDNYWEPLSGTRSLALSNSGPGAIEQSFSTANGAVYRLTFWLTGEPFSSPTLKHLRVTAGSTVQDFTYDVSPAWHWDMHWLQQTLDFTANSANTMLRFASLDASQWGPAIDSAKVVLVSAGVSTLEGLALSAVMPDPVQGRGRLTFSLPAPGRARLSVYDVQGRELARLVDGEYASGPQTLEFSPAAWGARPGLCVAVLHAAGRTLVRRFTVLH